AQARVPGGPARGDAEARRDPHLRRGRDRLPRLEDGSVVSAYAELTKPLALTGVPVSPDLLRSALLVEFPSFGDAIQHVVEDVRLRQWAGLTWTHFRPLLLVGPPGIGKSRFARRLAHLLGGKYAEIDVAGSSDNRSLQGTARAWKGAQPAWPILIMKET